MHVPDPLLVPLLLLAGCANTIDGAVDGNEPGGAEGSIFHVEHQDLGVFDDVNYGTLVMSNVDDACEANDAFQEVPGSSCETTCANLALFGDQYVGSDDLWALYLFFVTGDTVPGTYTDDDLAFTALFFWIDEALFDDPLLCEDTCEDDPSSWLDGDWADDGAITIETYETDALEGSFSVSFDGEVLEGEFAADPCDMEAQAG